MLSELHRDEASGVGVLLPLWYIRMRFPLELWDGRRDCWTRRFLPGSCGPAAECRDGA
jgi:hypothetical protein